MKTRKLYMSENEKIRVLPHETEDNKLAYVAITAGSATNVLNVNENNIDELLELLCTVMEDYGLAIKV